jgi:hypothetical protein
MPTASYARFHISMPSRTYRRNFTGVVCSMYHTIGCFGGLIFRLGSAFSRFHRVMYRSVMSRFAARA